MAIPATGALLGLWNRKHYRPDLSAAIAKGTFGLPLVKAAAQDSEAEEEANDEEDEEVPPPSV